MGPRAPCPPQGSPTLWMSQGTMPHGVMVVWELSWEPVPILPLCCWVLGIRFSPSALEAPADIAEQTPPGQG